MAQLPFSFFEGAPGSVSSRLKQTNVYPQSLTAGQKTGDFIFQAGPPFLFHFFFSGERSHRRH